MAESSRELPIGTAMPRVSLKDAVTGSVVDVNAVAAGKKGALVAFICNHCPYVVHIRKALVQVAHEAIERGLAVVAINSNDEATYPQDGPPAMAKLAKDEAWRFPFLFDETQDVARAFGAACTPDLFVFDAKGELAYHGQFDETRPSSGKPANGRDLRAAIEAVASGKAPSSDQKASIGCSIKWKR